MTDVTHVPAEQVRAAFGNGTPLVQRAAFRVHASRRDGPGEAELHEHESDIFFVLTGSAIIITGGAIDRPARIAPGEVRGPSITGGEKRSINPGDVVIIPRGTPHWFQTVSAPLLYHTVKVVHAPAPAATVAG
jgi:mannose-6-phosphate isomerase-like protein (cupin superfamily)